MNKAIFEKYKNSLWNDILNRFWPDNQNSDGKLINQLPDDI